MYLRTSQLSGRIIYIDGLLPWSPRGGDHQPAVAAASDRRQDPARRRTMLTLSSTHGEQQAARRAYVRIAQFCAQLRVKAERLDAVQRWYRILSEALQRYLRGRQQTPPAHLQSVGPPINGCAAKPRGNCRQG